MIHKAKTIAVTIGILLAGVVGFAWANTTRDIPVLDVDLKTHLAENLDKSTYALDDLFLSPNDTYAQILLTSFMNERDGYTLIRLRDGEETATIPYFPIYGDLYVSGSIVQEFDLRYYNFAAVTPDKRPDMTDMSNAVATTPQEDIAPILEIIDLLDGFEWIPFKGHCYKNRFPDVKVTTPCPHQAIFDPAGNISRRDIVETYIDQTTDAYTSDNIQALEIIGQPVLGAWIQPDGTLVRAELTTHTDLSIPSDTPWSDRKFNLELHMNFQSQYAAIRANQVGECFSNLETPKRQYTPTQSQVVFEGLYAALGPPEFGGDLLVDPVRQERLAWGLERLVDEPFSYAGYHSTRAWDRHYTQPREAGGAMKGLLSICNLVEELETRAGYAQR